MMGIYASETSVSVEKSRAEIEATVQRYGAAGFMVAWKGQHAIVEFEMKDRRVRFVLVLPDQTDKRFTHSKRGHSLYARTPEQARKEWEQGCRQKWRALALAVKAKLEAVQSNISTFEHEFLAHVVMADGMTIGEKLIPMLAEIAASGKLPPLLPGPVN